MGSEVERCWGSSGGWRRSPDAATEQQQRRLIHKLTSFVPRRGDFVEPVTRRRFVYFTFSGAALLGCLFVDIGRPRKKKRKKERKLEKKQGLALFLSREGGDEKNASQDKIR